MLQGAGVAHTLDAARLAPNDAVEMRAGPFLSGIERMARGAALMEQPLSWAGLLRMRSRTRD
jgi:hypothetical protein